MDERLYCKALLTKIKREETGEKVFQFRATTEAVDRQNEVVTVDGWDTKAFEANPVFLWAHDYRALPIGKVARITPDSDGLLADVVFDQQDELARQVQSKYERGYLSAVSVGFRSIEMDFGKNREPVRHTQKELLEISGVPVPANAEALMLRGLGLGGKMAHPPHTTPMADMDMMWDAGAEVGKAEGAQQLWRMHAWRDGEGDPESKSSYKLPHHTAEGQVVWRGVAAAMAAMMGARGGTNIPEGDRRGVYTHLARHYSQFDKEPPEFKSAEEIAAFGPEEVKGLFWEGELDELPVQKAGRKLSKATLERMRRVMDLMGQAMGGMQEMMDEMEGSGGEEQEGEKGQEAPGAASNEKEVDLDLSGLEAVMVKELDLSALEALVGKGE